MSLPDLSSRSDVAALLGVAPRTLTWWIWVLNEDRRYTTFEVRKRDGDTRTIRAPIKPIKDMQRALADVLLESYDAPSVVHGYTSGRSTLSNASIHVNQEWLLKVDLEDFFPSINFGRVRGLFLAHPFDYPPDVATTLAQLCCFENELPQGAPTSPILSNLICRGLDRDLSRIAQRERCFVTRYADDIAFSTDRLVFPVTLAESLSDGSIALGSLLGRTIRQHGFRVNSDKTRLIRRTQRQRVTGLVVNEVPNVSREYIRSLRSVLYIWEQHGELDAAEAFQRAHPASNWPPAKASRPFRSAVAGRVQHVGAVKGWGDPVYRALALRLRARDPTFDPRTLRTLHGTNSVRLFVEGQTDIDHLKAAIRHFHEHGEFVSLDIQWDANAAAGGDAALLRAAEGLAMTRQATPCVCVFDRDRPNLLPKAVGSTGFRDYTNRVAAISIVLPSWLPTGSRACIEFLYPPGDLNLRDASGRRLYLSNEFDGAGDHRSEPVSIQNFGSDSLVRDSVEDSHGNSVGLSKAAFASDVLTRTPPFDGVSFEGFRPTLEVLDSALARIL